MGNNTETGNGTSEIDGNSSAINSGAVGNSNETGNDNTIIDPATATGTRKRGRPAGTGKNGTGTGNTTATGSESATGNKTGNKKKTNFLVDRNQLANQIFFVHAAAATKIPIAAITPAEAQTLANPLGGIIEEYGFEVSAKTMLFSQLILALITVYGPKIVALKAAKQNQLATN